MGNYSGIIIGIGILAVISIVGIVVFFRNQGTLTTTKCVASDAFPEDLEPTVIGSSDNKVLFNGTLIVLAHYRLDNGTLARKYIRLTPTKITNWAYITLASIEFDCGKIALSYTIDDHSKRIVVPELDYESDVRAASCILSYPMQKCSLYDTIPNDKHFSIDSNKDALNVYSCQVEFLKEVAQLYLPHFEIEFNRSEKAIPGVFETPANVCKLS